jgi:3-phosphoshikimate 1-carboxyvinyltransferase
MSVRDTITLRPARSLRGSLRLPGDKSISHRYAMLAALAEGTTRFENFSTGADCASTLGCVAALGADVHREGSTVAISGRSGVLRAPQQALDCGNSGSTMRMLSGILAGQRIEAELRGDASLSRRPMGRIAEPLRAMGADISAAANDLPPLRIRGRHLRAIEYRMPVASAQVKSALLFAGLQAEGKTWVEEPVRTRDHGELALAAFGAEVTRDGMRAGIAGGQRLHGIEAVIPGDISSAAFFLCAAALFPGAELLLDDVLLNPTRAVLLDVLGEMGMRAHVLKVETRHGEMAGTLQCRGPERLRGTKIGGARAAALIDELPVLAAIAPYTDTGMEITGARELRVKESDRLALVAQNLRALGAHLEERDDGWRIPGNQPLHGAALDSGGDHRIAMAFAVAALRADGESSLRGADAAAISFPEFFALLEKLAQR